MPGTAIHIRSVDIYSSSLNVVNMVNWDTTVFYAFLNFKREKAKNFISQISLKVVYKLWFMFGQLDYFYEFWRVEAKASFLLLLSSCW